MVQESYNILEKGWTNCSSQSHVYQKDVRVFAASDTPNYHALKAAGAFIPPRAYHVRTFIREDRPFPLLDWGHYGGLGNVGQCLGGFYTLQYSLNFKKDLRSVIKGRISEDAVNVAMAFAERKETLQLMTNRIVRLTKAARYVRRGKFKKASDTLGITLSQRKNKRLKSRNRLDQFSDNWLEFRYGWTPLIYDVYNASNGFADDVRRKQGKLLKVATSESAVGTVVDPRTPHAKVTNYKNTVKCTGRKGIGVYYRVIDPDAVIEANLGLTNPALIAWELVPFSFVADWFLPIGEALEDLTAFSGLQFVAGYEYTKISLYHKCNSLDYSGVTKYPNYEYTEDTFNRTVLTSFDDLKVDVWRTSNGLNAVRCLDALALLQGFHKSSIRS